MKTKTCKKCGEEKPLDGFARHKAAKDGRANKCKVCNNKYSKEYAQVNKEKLAKYRRKESSRRRVRDKRLQKSYGVSLQWYEDTLKAQGGCCVICGTVDPGGNNASQFCVDHCHDTGNVRGLLCHKCNTGIGFLGDSLETLELAVQYLRDHKGKS